MLYESVFHGKKEVAHVTYVNKANKPAPAEIRPVRPMDHEPKNQDDADLIAL